MVACHVKYDAVVKASIHHFLDKNHKYLTKCGSYDSTSSEVGLVCSTKCFSQSSTTHPDFELLYMEPGGPPFSYASVIRMEGKMSNGGMNLPVALLEQQTTKFVPLSQLVAAPTCFWPLGVSILPGPWTVVILDLKTLNILFECLACFRVTESDS